MGSDAAFSAKGLRNDGIPSFMMGVVLKQLLGEVIETSFRRRT